jgi:iron complex outermembrane recepter protein
MIRHPWLLCVFVVLASGIIGTLQTAASAADTEVAAPQLAEIVVTARKREELLQTVPISIAVLTAEEIEDRHIWTISDAVKYEPSLSFTTAQSPGLYYPAIRGMGLISTITPSVGVLVDGVDQSNDNTSINGTLLDIERVEIVKGPQSAAFGRGVIGGAINFVTKRPSFDPMGEVDGSAGQGDYQNYRVGYTGPITDWLAWRGSAQYYDYCGSFTNGFTHASCKTGAEAAKTGVLSLLAKPSDTFTAYARYLYSSEQVRQIAAYLLPVNGDYPGTNAPRILGELPDGDPDLIANNADNYPGLERIFNRGTVELDWTLSGMILTSLTNLNHIEVTRSQDTDFTADPQFLVPGIGYFGAFHQDRDETIAIYGEELRLASAGDSPLSWLVGAYANHERHGIVDYSRTGITTTRADGNVTPQTTTVSTTALFGQLIYRFSPRWSGSLELRAQDDEIGADATLNGISFGFPAPAGVHYTDSTTYRSYTPRYTLSYQLAPAVFLYANAAKGTEPGGYNIDPLLVTAPNAILPSQYRKYAEEQAWSYEIGAKSTWLSQQLTFDVAAFYVDWTDLQVRETVPFTLDGSVVNINYVANAGGVLIRGAEAELAFRPATGFSMSLAWSHNPARFKASYPNGTVNSLRASALPGATVTALGDQVPQVPDDTVTAAIGYERATSRTLRWFTEVDARWASKIFVDETDAAWIAPHAIAELRTGFRGTNWDLWLYANNLFNDERPAGAFTALNPTTFATTVQLQLQQPRQLGGRVIYRF